MAIAHAQPGQVMSITADLLPSDTVSTRTLFKTDRVEVIRLVLQQGKSISEHRAPGEIVVQGLTGQVQFIAMGTSINLQAGQMFYLAEGEPHTVTAIEDCSFLLTILLVPKANVSSTC